MKFWILFTSISSLLWIGSGQDNELETNKLIQKICKIAKDKLHVHTYTPEDRIKILNTLKQNFLKAAKSYGYETSMHMKRVVQGVSILLHEGNYQKLCMGATTDVEKRNIYKNLTIESANFTVIDTIPSNETTLSNDTVSNNTLIKINGTTVDMDHLFSNIDTLIEKTIEKSKEEEVNVQKVKSKFLEDSHKSRKNEVNFTKELEKGVDRAKEKNMSLRRMFDERSDNKNITNPVVQLAKKPTKDMQLNKSEIASDQDKANMYSKIDTVIKKTANISSHQKQRENARNIKRRFLEGFKKVHGDEVDFTKGLEIGVDKAIEKHISLRRMLDKENANSQAMKSVAEIKKPLPGKTEIATDQDKERLFSKIETLVQKTMNTSSIDKQQENVQKIKQRFLTDFRRFHSDEVSFIQLLENRFDGAINKQLNMRRGNGGRNITTPAPDVAENANESATDQDKARLFSKIENLIQKTVDTSPAEKQKQNVDKIKRKFLEEFRKSHSKEVEFVQLLEKRFDEAINKHFKNPSLGEKSLAEAVNKFEFSNQSKTLTDDKHGLYSEIETLIQKSIDESPYEKQEENVQKVKRRFLEDYRKSNMDQVYQMEKTFDNTIARYLSLYRTNAKIRDPSAQIAEEALMDSGPNYNVVSKFKMSDPTTATPYLSGVTKEYNSCSDIIENACNNLRDLDKLPCKDSTLIVSSIQVCDGNSDCPDGSDERNCIQQVISRIHGATSIMSRLELHKYCVKSLIENSLLTRQGDLLSGLLNSQIRFLQKYSAQTQDFKSTTTFKPADDLVNMGNYHYVNEVNEIVNEVAIIVRSFRTTLTGALCTNNKEEVQKQTDEFANIDGDLEQDLHRTKKWHPFSCVCDGAFCATATNCNPKCQKLCYQEHVLTEFSCKSVQTGQNSISLDLICDGKVDCYDEMDEKNCPVATGISLTATARFEGSKIFDKIINKVNEMALNREFEPGRMAMTNFGGCIQRLHKLSIAVMLDLNAFRSRRNLCFDMLKNIYAAIVAEVEDEEIKAKAYDALIFLRGKLIEGLRQTHFGNERVAPPNQCICRGAECALLKCPPGCIRECFVTHKLTRYPCPSSNDTISVEDLCNKKINCPKAEDETNCKQEACRNYHAKMLRLNLKKVLDEYKDAILGKVLEPWVNEATEEILTLENGESRLSPGSLKETIKKIVADLATTYYNFETRLARSSRRNLQKFMIIATQVMESATSCIY